MCTKVRYDLCVIMVRDSKYLNSFTYYLYPALACSRNLFLTKVRYLALGTYLTFLVYLILAV